LNGAGLWHPSDLIRGYLNIGHLRAPRGYGAQVVRPVRCYKRIPATTQPCIPLVGRIRDSINLLMIDRVGGELLRVDRLGAILHLSNGHGPLRNTTRNLVTITVGSGYDFLSMDGLANNPTR